MKVVCDTDILSSLAKADELKVLKRVFPEAEFLISDRVFDELLKSKREGFSFPQRIFDFCAVIDFEKEEFQEYQKRRKGKNYLSLSNADIANLVIAKERNHPLISNDSVLLKKAESRSVLALDMFDLFRILFIREELSFSQINSILNKIEDKDNTNFKDRDEIFK